MSDVTAYAAVFNERAQIGPLDYGFQEEIAPGAFADALRRSDTVGLLNHNPDKLLGRASARTLSLAEDRRGLRFSVSLPPTSTGEDVGALVRRGDICACSFSFEAAEDGESWYVLPDRSELRVITKLKELYDVSLVTFPAYAGTAGTVAIGPDPQRSFDPVRLEHEMYAHRQRMTERPMRARLARRPERFRKDAVQERRFTPWGA